MDRQITKMYNDLNVHVKYLSDVYEGVRLTYSKKGDAGVDLRINEDLELAPGECKRVGTGVAISLDSSKAFTIILPRSGLGSEGLILGNTAGVIDSGYQGELILVAWNRNLPTETNSKAISLKRGSKVAQMVFLPFLHATFIEVEQFTPSERGKRGFGSSGLL